MVGDKLSQRLLDVREECFADEADGTGRSFNIKNYSIINNIFNLRICNVSGDNER